MRCRLILRGPGLLLGSLRIGKLACIQTLRLFRGVVLVRRVWKCLSRQTPLLLDSVGSIIHYVYFKITISGLVPLACFTNQNTNYRFKNYS